MIVGRNGQMCKWSRYGPLASTMLRITVVKAARVRGLNENLIEHKRGRARPLLAEPFVGAMFCARFKRRAIAQPLHAPGA